MEVRTVTIEGRPVPKGRPRVFRGHAVTPRRTQQAEEQLLAMYRFQNLGEEPFTGPVEIHCVFFMPIAKTWSKHKQERAAKGLLRCTVRPDLDNLVKLVLDALNGVAYADDSQIVRIHAFKKYSGAYPDGATIVDIVEEERQEDAVK
ncbi:RusA family crossover junction endodeoxyribonuclease [Mobilibacterium timonense]|uniref:RusA family crossover junction endodeoxyribonuclease n=1 Tax=Mobilibacterium timonense TaxID=1871012 RepID=UPI0009858623|nr:RusA family crossover junction endodeoxyribonuclease [Mobilibacterium timonense]